MKTTIIEEAKDFIEDLFKNDSGGHDADHSLRVYNNALKIFNEEGNGDLEIISLAALLHDSDDHKLFETKDNANARRFLNDHDIDEEKIERICETINSVSFSQNRGRRPVTIEAMIVQDADRLDAIGAIGIARTFAFGGEHKRPLSSSVQHFYDKLLLLKDEMNTQTGKKLAQDCHMFMEEFLRRYFNETELNENNG